MFRCELCDSFLPVFQFSSLCPVCYKIRTIVKCYSAAEILSKCEENFLVSDSQKQEIEKQEKKFQEDEEKRLENEFNKQMGIKKEEGDETYEKPKLNPNAKSFENKTAIPDSVIEDIKNEYIAKQRKSNRNKKS